jgi:hypothetical protein
MSTFILLLPIHSAKQNGTDGKSSGPGISYATPQPEAVEAFRRTLAGAGVPAYLRKPRGRDIYAACGQLKRTVEGNQNSKEPENSA